MAVLPSFEPQGAPADTMNAFDAGQSWVARRQQMEIQKQQAQRQQEDWEITQPLRVATAKADVSKQINTLVGSQQALGLIAQANQEMPSIRQLWKETYDIKDEDTRLGVQDKILSDASRYSSVTGIGDEIKSWHEIWTQGQLSKRSRDMIAGRSEVQGMKDQTAKDIAQVRTEMQKQLDETKQKAQEDRQAHQLELANLRAKNTVETTDQRIQSEAASKENQKLIESGGAAARSIYDLKRGLAMLDDPDVRTGTGANFELKAQRLGTLLGFDTKGVAKTEQLQQVLGDAVLRRVNQTKGSISDKEMALFDSYSASMAKSPEGNKAILTALMRLQERDVHIAKMINDGRKAGKRESQIQTEVQDYVLGHDVFDGLQPRSAGQKNAAKLPDGWSIES